MRRRRLDQSSDRTTGGSVSGNINLVAYSTPQEVYEGALEPDFQKSSPNVEFSSLFGSSGDQSRAVEAGQPADVVHLPLEPDMTRIVDAGIIADDYRDAEPYGGSPQTSVVTFAVRGGNPKDIKDWDDLIRDDVSVITPNPFTSGGARWNIMAAYGAQINQGKSEDEALQYVADMLGNTAKQDASASDALETFTSGEGDVLISYENEAIRAQDAGEDVDYVIPDDTIKIETLAAVTEDSENPEAAQAFLDYLYTPEAQQIWADNGYRPSDPTVLKENEATPDSEGPIHDRRSRRMDGSHHRVLRPGERLDRCDRAGSRSDHRLMSGVTAQAETLPRPAFRPRLGSALLSRRTRHDLPQHHGADPDRGTDPEVVRPSSR